MSNKSFVDGLVCGVELLPDTVIIGCDWSDPVHRGCCQSEERCSLLALLWLVAATTNCGGLSALGSDEI